MKLWVSVERAVEKIRVCTKPTNNSLKINIFYDLKLDHVGKSPGACFRQCFVFSTFKFFGVKFMDSLKLIISMITIVILKTQHDDRPIVFSNSVLEPR